MLYLYPREYNELITKYASKYSLDESLIYAIIKCESGFDQNAYSNAGAIGLMQITPDTYEWAANKSGETYANKDELYDTETNIKYGCYIYSILKSEFEDDKTTLTAYNAGRGKVLSWLEDKNYSSDGILLNDIPYPETSNYVDKVIVTQKIYSLLYYRG